MSFLNMVLFQNEIRTSVLLGINFTVQYVFILSCGLLVLIESDCGVPSVDKSINTNKCLWGKALVQKH